MTTDAAPLFGSTELAERIERVESHRRRGVQTALLSTRLADAAPAVTSPSSPPSRDRNRSRMCNAKVFTCSTPVRCW